jgi:hypothetical protein
MWLLSERRGEIFFFFKIRVEICCRGKLHEKEGPFAFTCNSTMWFRLLVTNNMVLAISFAY